MQSVSLRSAFALASVVCCTAGTALAGGKATDQPVLPSADVRLALVTPSATSTWTVAIENHDTVPVRVIADARNLRLLLRRPDQSGYTVCSLPSSMRGGGGSRELVLKPGDRYEEQIEPELFCWNKLHALLAPGTSVTAFLGWEPDKRLERTHKPQKEPFVLSPAEAPAVVRSDKQLVSLTSWLPAPPNAPESAPPAGPASTPLGLARPELSVDRFEDADSFRSARVQATVKNVGDRSGVIHLRADTLELRVSGPYGTRAICSPPSGKRAVARDFFQTIAPGKSSSVQALVTEVCPRGTFDRPGLYTIDVMLRATERGTEYGLDAVTGEFHARERVLLRVRQSVQSYHRDPPAIVRHQRQRQ